MNFIQNKLEKIMLDKNLTYKQLSELNGRKDGVAFKHYFLKKCKQLADFDFENIFFLQKNVNEKKNIFAPKSKEKIVLTWLNRVLSKIDVYIYIKQENEQE